VASRGSAAGHRTLTTAIGCDQVTFDNLILTAAPGSRTSITFTVLEPTNIDPLEIQVQMRECVAGEVDDGNQCKKCPPGR